MKPLRSVGVCAALFATAALAYVLPGSSVLRRLGDARDDLRLTSLRVNGTVAFTADALLPAADALGVPPSGDEVRTDATFSLRIPGRCRLDLLNAGQSRQAVVVARDVGPSDRRLVAYVVYQPGSDLTVSEVRRHLRASLPEYMVPSLVVAMDAIPLTPNGKVDRAALPDPFGHAAGSAQYEPPTSEMELLLAGVWAEVLKIERVGVNDNFFDLGGHSLLSLRVAAAVATRSGWRMDPRTLFFQTLGQIAATATSAPERIRRRA